MWNIERTRPRIQDEVHDYQAANGQSVQGFLWVTIQAVVSGSGLSKAVIFPSWRYNTDESKAPISNVSSAGAWFTFNRQIINWVLIRQNEQQNRISERYYTEFTQRHVSHVESTELCLVSLEENEAQMSIHDAILVSGCNLESSGDNPKGKNTVAYQDHGHEVGGMHWQDSHFSPHASAGTYKVCNAQRPR